MSRETLAVFLQVSCWGASLKRRLRDGLTIDPPWVSQPNKDEVVSKEGETFGQFSERVSKRHYVEA